MRDSAAGCVPFVFYGCYMERIIPYIFQIFWMINSSHFPDRSWPTGANYSMTVVVRNVEYSILLMMSELSTVRCDRALGLWLQVHGRRVSTESCRRGAQAGRQLWRPLLDRGRER